MRIVSLVFSPTGGTQRVADLLTAAWGGSAVQIDLTDAKAEFAAVQLKEDDLAVLAVPSYGGRVPALAAQRIGALRGNRARCVAVCVYGNRAYEDTLVELGDLAEKSGFRLTAAVSAVAEHSIMHQYATGRPDAQDADELRGFAERILEKVNSVGASAPQAPGNRPYKKAGGAGLVPQADEACDGCGLCAEDCPAQAISREKLKTADRKKCISCMRCVARCPRSARKVNSAMVSVVALAIKKACATRKANELYL